MIILKKKLVHLTLASLLFTFTACVTDGYDLSDGINTDMTIGGDSLSMPIGKTDSIFLKTMIDKQNSDMIKKGVDGSYSISFLDSSKVVIRSIDPVSFTMTPTAVPTIHTTLADIKFPLIQITPINIQSNLPIPSIDVSGKEITPINSSTTINRSAKNPVRKLIKGIKSTFIIGPINFSANQTISQSLNMTFPSEVKKVKNIYLQSNTVTLTFNKSKINQLPFDALNDTIKNFQIDFPSEFKLTSPVGNGTSIVGSSFKISNAILGSADTYTASFKIDHLDMSGISQNGGLSYSQDIPYSIEYSFTGVTADATTIPADTKLEVSVALTAKPTIDDIEVETNPYTVVINGNSSSIDQEVSNLPKEVAYVKSANFESGATLQINIADPGISPFELINGDVQISLPKKFVFSSYPGLNTSTNILTIPSTELFQQKNLSVTGINLNAPVTNQKISISDYLSYTAHNITVGATTARLSTLQAINNKKIDFKATPLALQIKDASVTTNKMYFDIPSKTTSIDVSQMVSKDARNLKSIKLKTPSELRFRIDFNNVPKSIDSIYFDNYMLRLPSCFHFTTPEVSANNELYLNGGFKVDDGYMKVLPLDSFYFGANGIELDNGVLNLHEKITLQGGAYVKGTNLNSSEVGTVDISPVFGIENLTIGSVVGRMSPPIDPVSQKIKLDLPDALKNSNNNLDIQNPEINLEIGNTMGLPVDIVLNIVPKRNGQPIAGATVTTPVLHITDAVVLGKPTWSKFKLTKAFQVLSNGYTSIPVPELPNILKSVPDSVVITGTPTVVGQWHRVDLYSPKNQVDLKYNVNIPLDFGNNFKLLYSDTINDLKDKLKDFIKYARAVEVVAVVENKIPMDMAFVFTPLDSKGDSIKGIVTTMDPVKYSTTKQTIHFSMKETASGALDNVEKVAIKVSASRNPVMELTPLRPEQFMIMELKVKIPKGLTIKN